MASGMLLGNTLLGMPLALESNILASQKAKESLSCDEKKWIDDSTMAKNLGNFFGKDFSCAESLLLVSPRYLGKPEDLVWAAAGFGGGIYNRDLCGFLTGGVMALGFASGMLKMSRKEAKGYCGDLVKDYWDWWGLQAPYRCAEIRTDETTSAVCANQVLLSAAKLEELLSSIKNKA
ncbi:MAG: C_GCAxxG_C_C family protein [Candidatus Aminicenantes bacterium]|nr:MAG: C_GCAxxG_C_C family protein [Candidatus Aminicenantes bacterium]